MSIQEYRECQIRLKGLLSKKEAIEKEIYSIRAFLLSPVCTSPFDTSSLTYSLGRAWNIRLFFSVLLHFIIPLGPLVDKEGFPLQNVDIITIRVQRHRHACIFALIFILYLLLFFLQQAYKTIIRHAWHLSIKNFKTYIR